MTAVVLMIDCAHCQHGFAICKSCYRGHKYCSESCRALGYRQNKVKARKKYDSSSEAKADHRDRQKAFRLRKKEHDPEPRVINSVTDQSSNLTSSSVDGPSFKDLLDVSRRCKVCGCRISLTKSRGQGGKEFF